MIVTAKGLGSVVITFVFGLALSPEGFAEGRAANRLRDSQLSESAAETAPAADREAGAARGARVGFDGLAPPPDSYTELLLVVETEGLPVNAPFELAIQYEAADLASPELVRGAPGVTLRRGSSGEAFLSLGALRDADAVVASASGLPSGDPLFCDPTGVGTRLAWVELQVLRSEPLAAADLPIQLSLRTGAGHAAPARACLGLAALSNRFYVPAAQRASRHERSE